ncbi:MAG: HAD-IA family hydrolase [Planctomycetota bacterium]|nr:HAD-IA family hydrolase [Planctomycetota bacterium]
MNTAGDRPIEAVCFDLGGVLIRICRSWEEGCAAAGVEPRGESGAMAQSNALRALVAALERGEIEAEAFFEIVSMGSGGLYSAAEVEAVHGAWLREPYEGCEPVVRSLLANRDLRLGCLSNTEKRHWAVMRRAPAVALLEHAHASHLLGHRKPDAAIFQAFELAVGVKGPGVLFFDDLEENVVAAASHGWRTVQIDHTGDTAAQIDRALRAHGLL